MKKFIIAILILVVLCSAAVMAYLLFTGPRMKIQPNIRHFQAEVPVTPEGVVPVKQPFEPLPSREKIEKLKNPLPQTPENIAKGKVYYSYYCVFCHGEKGDGFGPVGFSFNPVPANLKTEKVKSMSDGQLLYSMLKGTGHDPVLEKTVLPEHRWLLTLYIRQLSSEQTPASQTVLGPNSLPH